MSNDKHTPTPWEARGNYLFTKESKRSIGSLHRMNFNLSMAGTYMPCKESDANAARIVQCVNACDGLHDPEFVLRIMKGIKVNTDASPYLEDVIKELESLRAEKAELIEALRGIEVYKDGDTWLQDIIAIKKFASQTLAKLKTK